MPDVVPPAEQLGRVHFVGIGGAALSGIARIMARRGVPVTGSDDHDTPFLTSLRELDVPVHIGYDAAHIGDADTVVVTTAARDNNPEVLEAKQRGLRMLPRSAGLKSVMDGRRVLSVAGTHGKTTTTSLLTVALLHAGADPSYAVGGVLSATGRNADLGDSDLFVAEADESDGAFLVYDTYAGIVLNVDADHLDIWKTEHAYAAAFESFADGIAAEGFLICCTDDPGAAALAAKERKGGRRVITVGERQADLCAVDLRQAATGTTFDVEHYGSTLGSVTLRIPGRHYVVDALAALAMGLELGYDFDVLAAGLGTFTGTRRRMELKGEASRVRVYDTYAHHPSEIRGDLEAARAVAGGGRVVALFQPHLVSRTRIFGTDMGRELGAADEVIVLDVYLAREDADPEVTGALVAEAVPLPRAAVHSALDADEAVAEAVRRARAGDVVITLGAGDITELGPVILERLEAREAMS